MTLSANAQLGPVKTGIYRWDDLEVKTSNDRQSRPILEGTSTHFEYFEMHATTQFVGAAASTAHANEDIEELMIVREGTMEVTVEGQKTILETNGVLSLMPQQMHSVRNVGDTPLTYYVIRYRAKKPMNLQRGIASGGTLILNSDSLDFTSTTVGGVRNYFDRATAMCERLEMHVTTLDNIGPSHEPHSHDETEIILMISGNTSMTIDGKEYDGKAGDLYLIESQLFHGIRNAADRACSYFAFKWK